MVGQPVVTPRSWTPVPLAGGGPVQDRRAGWSGWPAVRMPVVGPAAVRLTFRVSHAHPHAPAGHHHGVSADADRRWLAGALALIVGFMAAEVLVGLVAHSLALLSDAAHMLTDAGAILLALVAMRLAARPARGGDTFGVQRAGVLSPQAHRTTLLILAGWLTRGAGRRL